MYLFDKELVKIRKEKGFSQEYLAKKIDCSRSYICKLESGERLPNKDLIIKITNAYNLDIYNLNKLLIMAELPTELNSSNESYKICLKLAIEFKELGLLEEAKGLIENSLKLFDNTVEIYALLANLHLMKKDFSGAIHINEEALKILTENGKQTGISKAEIIYNLGYVYFERGLEKKKKVENMIIEDIEVEVKNTKKIDPLKIDSIADLGEAIKRFESACILESENENIVEQLAVSYLNMASIEAENEKPKWLNKAIEMYDKFLASQSISDLFKRINASIFLSMAFARLYDLAEAARLINVVISCRPDYFLGYYAKGCIYSINGLEHATNLKIAYDNLQTAIEQNPGIREELRWDIDLLNLRFSELFKEKFKELYQLEQKLPEQIANH